MSTGSPIRPGDGATGAEAAAWLVESYWPPQAGSPDRLGARLATLGDLHGVRLMGVVHVPADEMALWRFAATAPAAIEAVCREAGIPVERIVEVVDLHP